MNKQDDNTLQNINTKKVNVAKNKLTAKQQAFVDYYTDVGGKGYNNGLQAAIMAGYSKKTAGVIANENLNKPYIMAEIAEKQALRRKKADYNYDKAIAELDMVINNLRPLANKGNVQANQALTAAIREKNAITGLHTQTVKTKDISAPKMSEAERRALADIARSYNVKLAGA